MAGRRLTIFLTPYFQFETRFDFMFVNLLCLPSWNFGNQCKLSWKSHGILLSDFCGNPVYLVKCFLVRYYFMIM